MALLWVVDIMWSLSSPDLTPTVCFSSLNSKVYQHRPQTLEALEKMITLGLEAISPDMSRRGINNYSDRLNQCFNNGGSRVVVQITNNSITHFATFSIELKTRKFAHICFLICTILNGMKLTYFLWPTVRRGVEVVFKARAVTRGGVGG